MKSLVNVSKGVDFKVVGMDLNSIKTKVLVDGKAFMQVNAIYNEGEIAISQHDKELLNAGDIFAAFNTFIKKEIKN